MKEEHLEHRAEKWADLLHYVSEKCATLFWR